MSGARALGSRTLTVRTGQMVFDVPSAEEGVDEVVYVLDSQGEGSDGSISLGGAWRGLVDGDAMLDAMGREAPPTPPITSIG